MGKINPDYIEKLYDEIAGKRAKGDYESYRWSNKAEKSRYYAMKSSIKKTASQIKFREYIELGPGPGTWTKIFIEKNPNANFTLVDISSEMLKQAKKKLGKKKNIKYIKEDFNKANFNKKFDFFFSSRAIEYLDDKEKAFKKIGEILERGSRGVIITKTPHPMKDKIYDLIGRKMRKEHKDQISEKRMRNLLEKNNFADIKFHPVVVEFPPSVRFNLPKINKALYKIFSDKKPNIFSRALSECYLVSFRKK